MRRLAALGAVLAVVLGYIKFAKDIFDWLPTIDFLIERGHQPGWMGDVVRFVTDPPQWLLVPAFFVGLFLIWLDSQRVRDKRASAVLVTGWTWANEREKREQVMCWLQSALSEKGLKIRRAFLFGSVLHDHYATSDVDLIVQFENLSERRVGKTVRRIREKIASDFRNTFSHLLHVTFFCADEEEAMKEFLNEYGKHEPLEIEK